MGRGTVPCPIAFLAHMQGLELSEGVVGHAVALDIAAHRALELAQTPVCAVGVGKLYRVVLQRRARHAPVLPVIARRHRMPQRVRHLRRR